MSSYIDLNVGTLNTANLNVTNFNGNANLTLATGNLFVNAISSIDANLLAFSSPNSNITLSPQNILALTISPTGLNLPSTSTLTLLNAGTAINASSATGINFSSATVTANTFSGTSVYASGTITGQNIYASGTIYAQTITGQNIYALNSNITCQNIYASGTITGQNIYASGTIYTQTITGQNIYTSNTITCQNISASETIDAQTITGQNIYASGTITCQNIYASNAITGQNIYATETIRAPTFTGQNIYATGIITGTSMYATTFNGSATSVNVTDDNTATVIYLTGVQGSSTGSKNLLIDSVTGPLTYVPSTGLLTAKCLTTGETGATGETGGAQFNSNIYLNGAITTTYTTLPIFAPNQVGYRKFFRGSGSDKNPVINGTVYNLSSTTVSLETGLYALTFQSVIEVVSSTGLTGSGFGYGQSALSPLSTAVVSGGGNAALNHYTYLPSGTVGKLLQNMSSVPLIVGKTQNYYFITIAFITQPGTVFKIIPTNSWVSCLKIA
jgi:hypothetical protein